MEPTPNRPPSAGPTHMSPTRRAPALADDLIAFIRHEVVDGPIDAETELVLSGLVDSLGAVLIVDWLEARLDIRIDPADVVIEHFRSVAATINYLRGRGDCVVD